jgi:hypothetical protein
MPIEFLPSKKSIKNFMVVASGSAVAASALPVAADSTCPDFPKIGRYANYIMCTKIPSDTTVTITSPTPANGNLVTFKAQDGSSELFYLSLNGADDTIAFTATGGSVPLDVAFLSILAGDLISPAADGK